MPARDRLLGIQAARGAAALLVVFYHTGRMLSLEQYVGHDPLRGVFSFGHSGVDFFFVLSGFIIYFVHHEDIGFPQRLRRYAWRRFVRIYPIYWVVTIGAIALGIAGHHYDLTLQRIVTSFLLLPQAEDPIVGVAWTLEHEVLFYTVFAVAIVNKRIGVLLAGAWLSLIIVGTLFPLPGVLLPFAASPYHLDFFFGSAGAALVLRNRVPSPLLVASVGLVLFLGTGIADDSGTIVWWGLLDKVLFGLAASLLITGIAAAERKQTIRFGRVAEFFGGMSYSLYLVHVTFIGSTAHLLMLVSIIKVVPGPIIAAFCIAVAVSAAAAFYLFIETPLLLKLQRAGKRPTQRLGAGEASSTVSSTH